MRIPFFSSPSSYPQDSLLIKARCPELAKEVVEALVAAEKHRILGLARKVLTLAVAAHALMPKKANFQLTTRSKQIPEELVQRWQKWPNMSFHPSTYESKQELISLLKDVDVVLCFFSPTSDLEGKAQMRLIDAAVEAGVKRYIPSEWFT